MLITKKGGISRRPCNGGLFVFAMDFLINLALYISVGLVWFIVGRNVFPKGSKKIGTIKIAIDQTDNEMYIAIATSSGQLEKLEDGDVVTMDVEVVRK